MKTPDFWIGHIEYLDEHEIICRLRKDYNLDKVLTRSRELLTERQNNMAVLGSVIRYDIVNKKIEFMLAQSKYQNILWL